jgi:hypothetical protein
MFLVKVMFKCESFPLLRHFNIVVHGLGFNSHLLIVVCIVFRKPLQLKASSALSSLLWGIKYY